MKVFNFQVVWSVSLCSQLRIWRKQKQYSCRLKFLCKVRSSFKGLCMYFCMDIGHLWCPGLNCLNLGKLFSEPLVGFDALYAQFCSPKQVHTSIFLWHLSHLYLYLFFLYEKMSQKNKRVIFMEWPKILSENFKFLVFIYFCPIGLNM